MGQAFKKIQQFYLSIEFNLLPSSEPPPLIQYFQVYAPTVRSSPRPITNLHLQPSEFTTRVSADRFMRQGLAGKQLHARAQRKRKETIQVATRTGELNQANDETKSNEISRASDCLTSIFHRGGETTPSALAGFSNALIG